MHYLDFLNEPPKIYIFQKEKNKTNFGGVLFFIYIIIMIMISLIYIFDYAFNDKYTYEALIFQNYSTIDKTELDRINNDTNLNPYIDLNFSFKDTDKFAIFNPRELEPWKYYENSYYYNFKEKVNYVFFIIDVVQTKIVNLFTNLEKMLVIIGLVNFKLNIQNMKLIMGKIFPFMKIILNLFIILFILIIMKEM